MSNNSDVILIAGTICEHLDTDGTTWKAIPRLTKIGAVGEQCEAKEKTTLEDKIKKYGVGMQDAADRNITGQYIPVKETGDEYYDDYVLQQAFIARCRNKESMEFRVTWPDGECDQFTFQSLGFQWDEGTQEDWRTFTCNGKQNSTVEYDVTKE